MLKKWLKRILISLTILVVAAVVAVLTVLPRQLEKARNRVTPHAPYQVSDSALAKHKTLTIMDWHCDALLWDRDLLQRSDYGHVDIPRLNEGNVAVQVFAAVTKSPSGQNYQSNKGDSDNITALAMVQLWPVSAWSSLLARAVHQADRLNGFAARDPQRLLVLRTRGDLEKGLEDRRQAAASGGTGPVMGLLDLEGLHCLEGKLENLDVLFEAGYRVAGLLHFFDNEVGGSLHGQSHGGLTDFGRAVVAKLDEKKMIIDLAHSSPQVVDEVLQLSTRPVVVSHTGVYGACKSPRNLTDEQMKRIAARGGLIGIGYWDVVCDISPEGVVRSLRYAMDLVGEDHVALGSDFDGTTTTAFDTSELAVLTQKMVEAGFTDRQIEKVMGGNSIRFLMANLP
jgi:microsomal dipeptidase-like Zn-dependent dipeptidase